MGQATSGQPACDQQPDTPQTRELSWQATDPKQPVAHIAVHASPEQGDPPQYEQYMLDMHGFFDIASACYADAHQASFCQLGRVLSEPEFLLGASYALWRALLEVKASVQGLSGEE